MESHVVVRVAKTCHRSRVEYSADLNHLLFGQRDDPGGKILVQMGDAGGAGNGNHVLSANMVQPRWKVHNRYWVELSRRDRREKDRTALRTEGELSDGDASAVGDDFGGIQQPQVGRQILLLEFGAGLWH